MKQEKILNLIKSGVDKTAPDCWEKINSVTEHKEGEVVKMSEIITESNNRKKGLAYGLGMAAAVAMVVGSSFVFTTAFAKSYVSIDINPSIELQTNGFGKITDVYAVNEDAKQLIEELDIEGKKIEPAVEEIIEEAIEEGYVSGEKENAILVSVDGKKPSKAENIKKSVTKSIDTVLEENVIKATVKTQNVIINKSIIEEAHSQGVSVGRLTVIERIVKEDDTVTLKEISKISVQDLLEYASIKDISLDDLLDSVEDAYEEINGEEKDDDDDKDDIDDDKEDIDDEDDDDKDDIDDEDDDDKDDDDDEDDNDKEKENNKYKTKNDNGNKDDKVKENNKYKTKNDNGNKDDDDDEDDKEDIDDQDDDDDDDDEEDDDDNKKKEKEKVKENNKYKTKNDNGNKNGNDDDDDVEDIDDQDDDDDDDDEDDEDDED